jgi:hypothetical protein
VHTTVELHKATEVFNTCKSQSKRLILVDSGAGGTVISDAHMFFDIDPPSQDVCIQFGTGPKIPIAGCGTIVLAVSDSCSHHVYSVNIEGAYNVPEQPLNILSVSDVLSIKGAVFFDGRDRPSHVWWHTAQGDVRQRMLWRRRLPYIESLFENKSVHAVRRVIPPELGFDLLHSTYGRMGFAKVKQLVAGGYLDAEKLRAHESFACGACEAANAKLSSYPSLYDFKFKKKKI